MHKSEYDNLMERNFKEYSDWHRAMYDGPMEMFANHTKPLSVLDVGCGIGYGCRSMRNHKIAGVYTGIDPDQKSIDYCERVLVDFPDTAFLCQDFISHDFGKFDLVFCIEVIEHVEESERAAFLAKVVDLADRVAFISTPDRRQNSHACYTPQEMLRVLRVECGVHAVAIPRDNTILYVANKGGLL